ncbi:uncharacterized protein PHALS_03150 [Plasmopara halstedii]|uniref:Uncharacterized protein n=1 Tax=Plasmopara halstedii TaxID=4781 RepID=A0A0P1A8P6_PLAHL|nr:uncharacterized protein PHALS_03150 [Plasmopara halstedii]CEG36605.1 hypothetical protein PHALS_03150 [Plasmopara halstedii]|eukprot:XP_024572974.1 hypothetical protein PHALS_03150 [Plasmopara halstedii]
MLKTESEKSLKLRMVLQLILLQSSSDYQVPVKVRLAPRSLCSPDVFQRSD